MIGLGAEPATRTDARRLPEALGWWSAAMLFFRFASPRILVCSLALWVGIRLWLGGWGVGDLWILAGIVLYWPVQEWFVHAFVLHLRPRVLLGIRFDPGFARIHRWHHRYPHVIERIFLPWQVVLALTPVNVAFWWLVTPSPARALTGVLAFTGAALVYEWIHYVSHVPVVPRSAYLRRVRRHHALHHFKNERYWHAFTVPLVDRWFGTAPDDVAQVPQSATVRTLGVDDPF